MGRAPGSCTAPRCRALASPPSRPTAPPAVCLGTAFGAADGGDSPGTLRRERLRPESASLRAAASEKKGFQGHSYFLGSRERQEMFPARSQEIGAGPCLQQEGCGAAGAGEVFSMHLR